MIRAIIIDDEARARRILEALLTEHCPDIAVVATASDVPEGVKAIHKHNPDVIFLDIEMPGYTGFQLLDFFDQPDFEIIFTTAYSEYAVQAFQVSAIDYLLKPIQIDQLTKAVDKVQRQPASSAERIDTLKANMQQEGVVQKIALPVADGLLFVETRDIIYLRAEGSYTNIYLTNGPKLLVSKKLKEFEHLLDQPVFFKTHRSFIINLNHVKQYVRQDGGYIVMQNDDSVSIARDRKDDFLQVVKRPG